MGAVQPEPLKRGSGVGGQHSRSRFFDYPRAGVFTRPFGLRNFSSEGAQANDQLSAAASFPLSTTSSRIRLDRADTSPDPRRPAYNNAVVTDVNGASHSGDNCVRSGRAPLSRHNLDTLWAWDAHPRNMSRTASSTISALASLGAAQLRYVVHTRRRSGRTRFRPPSPRCRHRLRLGPRRVRGVPEP
jgi:hypothetical protein